MRNRPRLDGACSRDFAPRCHGTLLFDGSLARRRCLGVPRHLDFRPRRARGAHAPRPRRAGVSTSAGQAPSRRPAPSHVDHDVEHHDDHVRSGRRRLRPSSRAGTRQLDALLPTLPAVLFEGGAQVQVRLQPDRLLPRGRLQRAPNVVWVSERALASRGEAHLRRGARTGAQRPLEIRPWTRPDRRRWPEHRWCGPVLGTTPRRWRTASPGRSTPPRRSRLESRTGTVPTRGGAQVLAALTLR